MAAQNRDILSDDIFLPNPYAGEGDTCHEPSYELSPHIDEVAVTRELAQYLLAQDLETPEGKIEYFRHSARLKEIVKKNFTSRGTTQELTQEHRWRELFWHEAKKPITRIATDLYLASALPDQAEVRLDNTRQQLIKFIKILDSRDMFKELELLFHISTEPSDIADLIRDACTGFLAQTEETASGTMPIELILDTGLYSEVNRVALANVIGELILNTNKYANSLNKGIQIHAFNCRGEVCIKVRDFGMGVPNVDDLWRFGERQTQTPGDDDKEGSGVGLYFVARAIQANRGQIHARNGTPEEGGGLHYEIFVPATTEAAYQEHQSKIERKKAEAAIPETGES